MLDLYTNLPSRSAQTLQGWGHVPSTDRDQVYLQRQLPTSAILHEAHKTNLGLGTPSGFQSLRSGSTIPSDTLSTCSPQNILQILTLPASSASGPFVERISKSSEWSPNLACDLSKTSLKSVAVRAVFADRPSQIASGTASQCICQRSRTVLGYLGNVTPGAQ
jgi:hypothetical protein